MALAASVVLYGVLAMVLRDRVTPLAGLPDAVHTVLHVLAGLLVVAGVLLFRRIAAPKTGVPGTSTDGPVAPVPALPPRIIVGWALFEAVGVLGLVASLTGGNGQILVLASLVLILLHPPRAEWFPPRP